MKISELLCAMTQRIVEAGVVTLDNDFIGGNLPAIDTSGKNFFVIEACGGYDESLWTNRRSRPYDINVRYTLNVPQGAGTELLDERTERLVRAFSPSLGEYTEIRADGIYAVPKEIKVGSDMVDGTWCMRSVIIYLRVLCAVPFS